MQFTHLHSVGLLSGTYICRSGAWAVLIISVGWRENSSKEEDGGREAFPYIFLGIIKKHRQECQSWDIFLSLILSGIQKFIEHMCERMLRCLDYMICMIHVRRWECCYGNCSCSWILSWRISQSTIRQAHLWTYLLGDIKWYFQFLLKRCIIFCPGILKPQAPQLPPLTSTQGFCDLEATEDRDLTEL